MNLYFDLRLGYLVTLPGNDSPLESLEFKAGDGVGVVLQFGQSEDNTGQGVYAAPVWTPESLTPTGTITIGIKESGDYSDGDLLASQSTFVHDAGADTYTFSLDFNTTEIDALLNRNDADDTNDVPAIESAGFEVTFKTSTGAKPRSSVKPITATIYHDVLLGGEGTPVSAATPSDYLLVADNLYYLPIVIGDETTAITTGTGKYTFRMPFAMTLQGARASVSTAPTDADIQIDINEGGTSIFSTVLSIDATEKTSTTATPAVISDSALADDAEISIDYDQVGSTVAGAGVKLWLIGTRT